MGADQGLTGGRADKLARFTWYIGFMATITFDTHKFVRRLQEGGFEEKQAEAISEAFKDASGEAELATKRDIERLEARFEKLETKLSGEMTLLKWMLGILLGGVIGLVMKAFFPA